MLIHCLVPRFLNAARKALPSKNGHLSLGHENQAQDEEVGTEEEEEGVKLVSLPGTEYGDTMVNAHHLCIRSFLFSILQFNQNLFTVVIMFPLLLSQAHT